jgi:hypothetical protein
MFRRHFLMGGIGIATAGTAFANSDGRLVSSIVEAIGAGGPVMMRGARAAARRSDAGGPQLHVLPPFSLPARFQHFDIGHFEPPRHV